MWDYYQFLYHHIDKVCIIIITFTSLKASYYTYKCISILHSALLVYCIHILSVLLVYCTHVQLVYY